MHTAVSYIECSIPEGMTIDEYRRSRPQPPRRGLGALVTRLRERGMHAPATA